MQNEEELNKDKNNVEIYEKENRELKRRVDRVNNVIININKKYNETY